METDACYEFKGETFFKWSPFLKMYTDYSNKYSEAVGLLVKLERKNPKFKTVVDECYLNSNYPLRINDLLIMPIQRIPRYSLLLTDLLKHTVEGHKDFTSLKEALDCIHNVAASVNEAVRRRENTVRLDEMQKEGFDLSSFIVSTRHLVKDGIVKVKIMKAEDQKPFTEVQYWILFNDTFVHCKKDSVKHVNLKDYAVPLSLVWVQKDKREVTHLVMPNETLTFKDETWESDISNSVDNFVSLTESIPKLRKYVPEQKPEGIRVSEFSDGNGLYIGQWKLGKRHGRGKLTNKDSVYIGEWQNDKPHGMGKWKYPTGGIYCGFFDEGLPHGKGVLKTSDQAVCSCTFSRGTRNGPGKIKYPNGDFFQGYWKKDKIKGEGKLICKDGRAYVGEWENNTYHGVGKLTIPQLYTYEGNFVHGIKSGRGCFIYSDESCYVGEVENGMRHGMGKMTYSGNTSYEGSWVYDLHEGFGRKTYEDESVYEGYFDKGNRHGHGKMIYAKDGIYDGEWENDRRHGEGCLTDKEGNVCTGAWVHDKLHGHVVINYFNHSKFEGMMIHGFKEKGKYTGGATDPITSYEGEWSKGLIHGKGTLTLSCGITYKGSFEYGTVTGDCTITYANGITTHATLQHDRLDGKLVMNLLSNETSTGIIVSNTLMNDSGFTLLEPLLPLWGRTSERDHSMFFKL
eukprot:TRINITY_DN2908_c0_g1_i7.p1 TRINITY_DN2908_c0_g1~~TRINITY_DN2908_c0_g1_i7.p1  ORF type:complete len:682 (-),score=128.01 TRINITY_DN2908_c0_g1_i7:199-2244(-)